jgi:large subunit ribosomal protein L4
LRSALAAKYADGKLTVVDSLDLKEPKTKEFRKALDALQAVKTALVVDSVENRNLELSSRNLDGVELVRGYNVHPYHLLRYEAAIFSRPALEKLQDSLKASASKGNNAEVTPKAAVRRRKKAEVA